MNSDDIGFHEDSHGSKRNRKQIINIILTYKSYFIWIPSLKDFREGLGLIWNQDVCILYRS